MSGEQTQITSQPSPNANRKPSWRENLHLQLAVFVVIVVTVAVSIVVLEIRNSREDARQAICATHLKQIGAAIKQYRTAFNDRYPDTLGDLLIHGDIQAESLLCPDSHDTLATGPTPRAVAEQVAAGGHCSYIYLGKGLTPKLATDKTVVVSEPLQNHDGLGINVLFGDEHIDFITDVAAEQLACASNLRQIDIAISDYCKSNQGRFPDTFGQLLLTGDIGANVFVCPGSNDTPAVGPTTQAVIANLANEGHCSYIYLGKGLTTTTAASDTIVAYEPLSNHNGDGMTVLFGDSHTDFITPDQATVVLKQVSDGKWPVVLQKEGAAAPQPTTQSTTQPATRLTTQPTTRPGAGK